VELKQKTEGKLSKEQISLNLTKVELKLIIFVFFYSWYFGLNLTKVELKLQKRLLLWWKRLTVKRTVNKCYRQAQMWK